MHQIRQGVFETNSSSTHSLSFSIGSKEPDIPERICLDIIECGGWDDVVSLKQYMYTFIALHDEDIAYWHGVKPEKYDLADMYIPKLENFFERMGVEYCLEPYDAYDGYLDDDSYNEEWIIDKMFNNDDQDEADRYMKEVFFGKHYVHVTSDR